MSTHNVFIANNNSLQAFNDFVVTKYKIFNGLFLSLPFKDIDQAGARLSIFTHRCEDGLNHKLNPQEIVETYLDRVNIPEDRRIELLFKFLQFIERQIVLFDALEDAAFNMVNDLSGLGTIDNFLQQVESNNNQNQLNKMLNDYKIRIVLTAHPTQFYPNTVLGIILNMGHAIKENNLNKIQQLFLQLGLTNFNNKNKPTPIDEAKTLIWYLEHILYPSLPLIQEKLQIVNTNTTNIEIGFWPGGDRDGNPFVTSTTTLEVAVHLKQTILNLYIKELIDLRFYLTFDGMYLKILEIIEGLSHNKYTTPLELINELNAIKQTLIEEYHSLSLEKVESMITKIKLFGFYFVKLDIRQNSHIHRNIINSLLIQNNIATNYLKLTPQKKIKLLLKNKNQNKILNNLKNNPEAQELINTLLAIYSIQQSNGNKSIERYIISNTESAANIFEILFLLDLIKCKYNQSITIEIVPLFETIDDLKNAPLIMQELYQNPEYLLHLKQHNMQQTIMLGFSDGTKDGGYLMANWSIYLAKKQLSQLSHKHEIKVVFFDGRGGPPSRGGGNTRDFYHSMGKCIDIKEIQLTVQGQTIYANFGTADSAIYNIEQIFTSGLTSKLLPVKTENINKKQEDIISDIAGESYIAYRELKKDPLFIPYLEEITTLKYLAEANIGSRPAKRNQDDALKLEDLRAIPFVGAWAQLKQNILGFYGLGTAINIFIKHNEDGLIKLQELYKESLFFKALLNNAIQSLAKSNFDISEYLSTDKKFGKFWQKLKAEAKLSESMLLKVSKQKKLLDMNSVTNLSSAMREQIILPLLIIQQYAMMKIRDENTPNKDIFEKLVKKSLAANINAGRNSI